MNVIKRNDGDKDSGIVFMSETATIPANSLVFVKGKVRGLENKQILLVFTPEMDEELTSPESVIMQKGGKVMIPIANCSDRDN